MLLVKNVPHDYVHTYDPSRSWVQPPCCERILLTFREHTPIGADGTCDISPSARFCITEAQIITALYNGLKLLKEEEEKAK